MRTRRVLKGTKVSGILKTGAIMDDPVQLSRNFWVIKTIYNEIPLVFFGGSRIEVMGRYAIHVRKTQLEYLRK